MANVTLSASENPPKIAALVVAAGRGTRAGSGFGASALKQYRRIGGVPVLTRTLRALARHPEVTHILTVIHPDDRVLYNAAAAGLPRLLPPVVGGASRQDSVRLGLEALEGLGPDLVLIHDAARPFLGQGVISRAIEAAARHGAAVPVVAPSDTVVAADAAGLRGETLDRSVLRMVQTPQSFRFASILSAHRAAAEAGRHDFTDDGAVAGHAEMPVACFAGDPMNVKLTVPEDFDAAERRLAADMLLTLADVRTGTGFDVHAFGEGDHVMLGGIAVPHERGLSGHSDADVALHALTDAILGALADGDIGSHFPPSDPRWKGADSAIFLAHAVALVEARGGRIAHLDVTIIGERPKVGPHRDAMRRRIAEITGTTIDRVGVKATTTEKLGFTGRSEGLAAMASATIRLPLADVDQAQPREKSA